MSMPSYAERIADLIKKKLANTAEKRRVLGSMDYDDHGLILPPEDQRTVVQTISGSGALINDVVFKNFTPRPTDADGGFYGPLGQGSNFRDFLCFHPPVIDPMCGLAGGYMVNFTTYRKGPNPDVAIPEELAEKQAKYKIESGVFSMQHFCQDAQILLDLGLDGLEKKIEKYRAVNGEMDGFYEGLSMTLDGIRTWILHNAAYAAQLAAQEPDPEVAAHLNHLCRMNEKLVHAKPDTFEEACQLMLWLQMACRSYNGSGSLGRLDILLLPYYTRDVQAGILDDEKAIFLIQCMLLRDTSYIQIGGYDADGNDTTNHVSYLILEAVHRLKLPSNIGVCVGRGIDRGLLRRSVEMQFEDKNGNPRFVGTDALVEGFCRNGGVTPEMARARSNSGCHWLAIPGREYSLMDCIKVDLAICFDYALRDAVAAYGEPTVALLLDGFRRHVREVVAVFAEGFTYHYEHQTHNVPELPLDLLCHGTIERGLDASNGGVDHYYWGIDGVAIAVVADGLAAIEQRIIKEKRYTYKQLIAFLDSDWAGPEGEKARLFFSNCPHYGHGGTPADEYARTLTEIFTQEVKSARTPKYGHEMVPGLFSWANSISIGRLLGATPNGRHAGRPVSHGANPCPGFRSDGAATAMSRAIASIQPGYGNTAPMQLEIEPTITAEEGGIEMIMALIEDHFAGGGTLINLNVVDAEKIRRANEDPSLYPDLVVRVTGFSAYFASLSSEFRQLVTDRVLDKTVS